MTGPLSPGHDEHAPSQRDSAHAPGSFIVAELFTNGRAMATTLIWVIYFMNLLNLYFLNSWLPTIISDAGIPVDTAIRLTSLFQIGGIGGAVVLGRLLDRTFSFWILAACYSWAAAFVYSIGHAGASVPLLALTITCAGVGIIGGQNASHALSSEFYPTRIRSTGVGWALGIGRIGSIVGPLVGGLLLAQNTPMRDVFWAAVIPANRDARGSRNRARHAQSHADARIVSLVSRQSLTELAIQQRARTRMDSNPGSNAPLQFDTAIPRVTPSAISTAQGVACALCQRTIPDQYYDVNGQSVCDGVPEPARTADRDAAQLGSVRRGGVVRARRRHRRCDPLLRRHRHHRTSRSVSSPSRSDSWSGGRSGRVPGPRRTTVPGAGAGADVLGGWSGVHAAHVQAARRGEREGASAAATATPTPADSVPDESASMRSLGLRGAGDPPRLLTGAPGDCRSSVRFRAVSSAPPSSPLACTRRGR